MYDTPDEIILKIAENEQALRNHKEVYKMLMHYAEICKVAQKFKKDHPRFNIGSDSGV